MNTKKKEHFIEEFSKAVSQGDAAFFVGAGLSKAAGLVDWRELLQGLARELDLDIERETDLVAVAQYHRNREQNRSRLNQAIKDNFDRTVPITENHRLLSRIPALTAWTTNYDHLLEDAFEEAGKLADVKISNADLAINRPGRDVVIYKMHGDAAQAADAILIKDDYERYESTHRLFVEALKGQLVSKTFLFVGFSLTDPNIDYILSRVRVLLGENQRSHYCILRKPQLASKAPKEKAEHDYELRKLQLRIDDLKRFGIQTVLIDQVSEITDLLRDISWRAHRRSIFVSGSARIGSPEFPEDRLRELSHCLGREIIARDFNLVSGFGRGLGDHVVLGALEAIYSVTKGRERNRVTIRPFPRTTSSNLPQGQQNRKHREDLISQAGVVFFLAGNRDYQGQIVTSTGVLEEFEICYDLKRIPIPIGCTGFAAAEILKIVEQRLDEFFPFRGSRDMLQQLNDPGRSNSDLLKAAFLLTETALKVLCK
jgi:hypothetical protein